MNIIGTDINLVLMGISILAIIYSIYKFRERVNSHFYRWLITSLISLSLWSVIIVLLDYTTNPILNGIMLNVFTALPITFAICCFISVYEFTAEKRAPKLTYIVFLIPIGLFLLAVFNPDNLVYSFDTAFSADIDSSVIPGELTKIRFVVNVGLGYALGFMSLGGIIFETLNTNNYTKIYQGSVFLLSTSIIAVLSGIRLLKIMPYGVDLSLVAINLMLILHIMPMRMYDLSDGIDSSEITDPVQNVDSPVILTGEDDEILRVNKSAEDILSVSEYSPSEVIQESEFECEIDEDVRSFQVTKVPLSGSDNERNTVYMMSDVTDLKKKIRNLSVAQQVSKRILRHNVKNRLNPIMGYAEMVDSDEYREKIERNAESLAETSDKAILMNDIINSENTTQVNISNIIKETVGDYGLDVIDINTNGNEFSAETSSSIGIVFRECIDNSIQHNDSQDLQMVFDIVEESDDVVVSYSDNGDGIPDHEIQVLKDLEESDLEHGTGCGLWMMKWIVESSDGSIDFDNENGTTVTVRLPKPETN